MPSSNPPICRLYFCVFYNREGAISGCRPAFFPPLCFTPSLLPSVYIRWGAGDVAPGRSFELVGERPALSSLQQAGEFHLSTGGGF